MDAAAILSGLEKIIESLKIKLRYDKGDFSGGYCVLKDKPMIIIQKGLGQEQKIRILAREIANHNIDDVDIIPTLRQIIDESVQAGNDSTEN